MLTTSYFREITVHSSELLFEVWDQVSLTVTLTKFQGQFKILFQGQKIGKSDAFMGLGIGETNKSNY